MCVVFDLVLLKFEIFWCCILMNFDMHFPKFNFPNNSMKQWKQSEINPKCMFPGTCAKGLKLFWQNRRGISGILWTNCFHYNFWVFIVQWKICFRTFNCERRGGGYFGNLNKGDYWLYKSAWKYWRGDVTEVDVFQCSEFESKFTRF